MSDVIKFKTPPEPIKYKGRERFIGGWSTSGCGNWLIEKRKKSENLGEQYSSVSEIAATFYPRDSQGARSKVRRNVSPLRQWLAERDYFLLVKYGGTPRKIMGIKICNPAHENDRQAASEQLLKLEEKEEITHAERLKWEQMLFLPVYPSKDEGGGSPEEGSGGSVA